MKEELLSLFKEYDSYAIAISLVVSILVAILGVIPSFFITAANILFFGFWQGTLVSFLGEAIGAAIAFFLYRKGFKRATSKSLEKFPKVQQLLHATGREAFLLILSLRLIPFVPSGLVTFAAAVGSVSAMVFVAASSLGKIPALLLEAFSVYEVMAFGWMGKIILAVIALALLWFAAKQIAGGKQSRK